MLLPDIVVDASALLAMLNAEPGAEVVAEAIPGAVISAVNLSEVVSKLSEAGMPESAIRHALQPLGMDVVPFDEEQAYLAGLLRIPIYFINYHGRSGWGLNEQNGIK